MIEMWSRGTQQFYKHHPMVELRLQLLYYTATNNHKHSTRRDNVGRESIFITTVIVLLLKILNKNLNARHQ